MFQLMAGKRNIHRQELARKKIKRKLTMAGFTTDFSNVKEFTEFKEQFYEFIVKDIY